MTPIKVCGLTQPHDTATAIAAGAAYTGVILASGPRLLDEATARVVLGPRRHGVQRVAVFGDQHIDDIVRVATALDVDIIQLHRMSTVAEVAHIVTMSARVVWPVQRLSGTAIPSEAFALARETGWLVLDAFVAGQLGGTGVALDWSGLTAAIGALRFAQPTVRVVLAGGLKPGNVAHAIRLLEPDVVDVSSGVEASPGIKDAELIRAFVAAVHSATESRV